MNKIKHFEQLWEEAEKFVEEVYHHFDIGDDIRDHLNYLDDHISGSCLCDKEYHMGQLLLKICYLSKKLDVNIFTALQDALNDARINLLEVEDDEDSETPTSD